MKHEYIRIDMMKLLDRDLVEWLHNADNCEWREDYFCFFVLKQSKTHIKLALLYGDIFD